MKGVPRNWHTFLDLAQPDNGPGDSRVVLLPVPYDSTTSYRGGSRYGPRAILNASRHLEDYDVELDRDVSALGIYTTPEIEPDMSGPKAMVERVEKAVRAVAAPGRLVGLLGGEHTVTTGAVRAMKDIYPDMAVLYFDAHADLRDEYMDAPWGHASVARRVNEMVKTVHVGVRTICFEERDFIRQNRLPVFFWPNAPLEQPDVAAGIVEALPENVYISIDLDVIDPALMPAVGTPEPGGMSWTEITRVLRAVGESRKIVGFDIVELAPEEGPESCSYIAAKLAYKLIAYATAYTHM